MRHTRQTRFELNLPSQDQYWQEKHGFWALLIAAWSVVLISIALVAAPRIFPDAEQAAGLMLEPQAASPGEPL